MAPVQYRPVPTMEMTPVAASSRLAPPQPQPRYSSSNSDISTSDGGVPGQGHRRDDRRRGRLNAELLTAVLYNNISEVTKKLEAGASVNATCRMSRTSALHLAVACGHLEVACHLLNHGADLKARDRAGRQAIHLAAACGHLLILQLILKADCSVVNSQVIPATSETVDHTFLDNWSHNHDSVASKIPDLPRGATPLHLATQRLYLDCVTELLNRGARVDLVDERGLTPLDMVGEIPPKPSINVLVDLADALPTSDETLTRLENIKQRIARSPARNTMNVRVRLPSDPDYQSPVSPSPLRVARFEETDRMGSMPSPPVELSNTFRPNDPGFVITPSTPSRAPSIAQRVANELIKKGAKMPKSKIIVKQGGVQNQMTIPMTCLHTAVEHQDLQLIEYLLDNGACQLTWNKDGLTPLHLAVHKQQLEALRILLEKNKTSQVVDARDLHGRTPLHLAVAVEWFAGVSLLLEAGADVKVTSNDSQSVLHTAAVKSETKLLEELLTIPESAKIIDSRNYCHKTPLCCAVSEGQSACVKLLIIRGADITTSLPGDVTLLHIAAERGYRSILEILLEDPRMVPFKNIRSKEGKGGTTALHLAAMGGFVDCVEVLLSSGCDVYAVTSVSPHYGSTALHLAAVKGHVKVVDSIIKHNKQTMCVQNAKGWYPLHVAARFAKKDCVRLMLLNGANLAATVFDSGGYKKTALDIIVYSILHPVSFLEKIFDCCIEVNEYPLNNPKCQVKVSYDILQPLGPQRKQLRVLDSLLNCGKHIVQEKLLLHPLVETFLYLKWKKLRVFFFLMMALYMVYTISLTTMAMTFYVLKTQSVALDTCVTACRILLCVSLTLITLQELLQVTRMQRYYIRDLESWVKWSSFVLASVVVLGRHPADWLVHVSAVAVLLSWLELLFLLSRWPSALGFYILMFFTVAKNVIRVLATFTFVIIGFTFAFMIHFEAKVPFDNWWEAFVKVMVMTLEFEYADMFDGIKGVDATSIVGRCIFLAFMVLVAIVLMNLLVGLAVSDIAALEKQGRAQRLAKQIDFLSLLELFVYNRNIFFCCPKKLSEAVMKCRATEQNLLIEPGKPLRKTRNNLPQGLTQSVINNIIHRKDVDDDSCDEAEANDSSSSESLDSLFPDPPKPHDESKRGRDPPAGESLLESEIKNSLQLIMAELATIKQDIQNMKNNSVNYGVIQPPPRLMRT